ncbi:hypothetical protein C8J57DRAFT_1466344 [Mycena rebaudengoi]|nr:hypothetical protein C8J57DRAFT_1466344 [Mycena rebaudengoi]
MKIVPYKLRRVFFIPLFLSIGLGSFVICYGWWRGDLVQMLLLAIHFLLFAPSAYFLQTKPVQPDLIHIAMLMNHVDIALAVAVINSIRVYGWKGLDFCTYDPDTGRITSSEVDLLVSVCIALLRLVAIWYTTAWTYLCCIVLSHSVDILTRKGSSPTYCSLRHFIQMTGFGYFVWIVNPAPFPDAYPPLADTCPVTTLKDTKHVPEKPEGRLRVPSLDREGPRRAVSRVPSHQRRCTPSILNLSWWTSLRAERGFCGSVLWDGGEGDAEKEVGRVQGVDVVRVEDGEMRVVDRRELREDEEDDDEWLDSEASARAHGFMAMLQGMVGRVPPGHGFWQGLGRVVVAWEALHSNSSVADDLSDTQPLPRHPDWCGASSRPCAKAGALAGRPIISRGVRLLQLRAVEMRHRTQIRYVPFPSFPLGHTDAPSSQAHAKRALSPADPASHSSGTRGTQNEEFAFVRTGNVRRAEEDFCEERARRHVQGHFFSD